MHNKLDTNLFSITSESISRQPSNMLDFINNSNVNCKNKEEYKLGQLKASIDNNASSNSNAVLLSY